MDSHKWKVTCLHELTGTNILFLHCLHFPLTPGPVLCSSGETVTSVTSISPLQPKKVKKKKEKEKLEQPPAIPAKGMKTDTEYFKSWAQPWRDSRGWVARSPALCHCLCLWGGLCLLPSMGEEMACTCCWDHFLPPCSFKHSKMLLNESKQEVSAPNNKRRERGTLAVIFTLLKGKMEVRQVEITFWGYYEGSQHTALFKAAGALGKSSKLSRWRPNSRGLHFPRGFTTPGSVSQTLGCTFWAALPVLSQWERGGKGPEDLGQKWSVLREYICSSVGTQTAYQIL